ncbi:MAG: tetratricopeptide repeat protein [Nocardioidaceae bacterium]
MRRSLLVGALATILVLAGAVGVIRDTHGPRATSAVTPVDPGVLTQLSGGDLASAVTALQTHLRAQPLDGRGWATLGVSYVEMARLAGDPSYYPKAGHVLARSLRVEPTDNDLALAGLAALAAARHEFNIALRESRASLAINPYQAQALAIRVDALTELGRYDAQLTALRQADHRQPGVPVFARYSYAEELRGRTHRAMELLRQGLRGATVPSDQAYLLTLLADLERRAGHLHRTGRLIRRALIASPDYVPALASRARLLVARDDLAQALRTWRDVTSRLALPEYLLERGELYETTGRPALAQQQFSVLQATKQLLRSNGVRVDLETALFEADHGSPSAALSAARTEWSRRHSVQVADALAWAQHVSGHDAAALRMSDRATRLGTPLAMFSIHRGLIEAALGRRSVALRDLRLGLEQDPGLSPWQADRARSVLRSLEGDR